MIQLYIDQISHVNLYIQKYVAIIVSFYTSFHHYCVTIYAADLPVGTIEDIVDNIVSDIVEDILIDTV